MHLQGRESERDHGLILVRLYGSQICCCTMYCSLVRPVDTRVHFGVGETLDNCIPCSCFITKRCRLSASPATGLVGMEENVLLSDFFLCFGILPLASERCVLVCTRKMLSAKRRHVLWCNH